MQGKCLLKIPLSLKAVNNIVILRYYVLVLHLARQRRMSLNDVMIELVIFLFAMDLFKLWPIDYLFQTLNRVYMYAPYQ